MQEVARCSKCGRPLTDPESIARGMGPECAGLTGRGRRFRSSVRARRGHTYAVSTNGQTPNLFTVVIDKAEETSDERFRLRREFPSDLVDLVLSAPAAGAIAARVKWYSRRKQAKVQTQINPSALLKQIRQMCIDFHWLFWPGMSKDGNQLACIPCGESEWKIGEDGKVISRGELENYLRRYGIIGS